MIEFTPGTVYDVAHLRPFDLELALQGYPLATAAGREVRHLRFAYEGWLWWDMWGRQRWFEGEAPTEYVSAALRLAPLAVKDRRGLHVGDEIICGDVQRKITWLDWLALQDFQLEWRWPESK